MSKILAFPVNTPRTFVVIHQKLQEDPVASDQNIDHHVN